MVWYETLIGKERLRKEYDPMSAYTNLKLLEMPKSRELSWDGRIQHLGHLHRCILIYSNSHPFEPIKLFVFDPELRKISHHIREHGEICYIDKDEWKPEYTAFTVYLTLHRFLDDYYRGRLR